MFDRPPGDLRIAERINDNQLALAVAAALRPFNENGVGQVKADGAIDFLA